MAIYELVGERDLRFYAAQQWGAFITVTLCSFAKKYRIAQQ